MLSFNQTITIYDQKTYERIVVHKASWSGGNKVRPDIGLEPDFKYTVRILQANLPKNLNVKVGDYVLLGEGPDVNGISELNRLPDHFTVLEVRHDNLTRLLPHLKIQGS